MTKPVTSTPPIPPLALPPPSKEKESASARIKRVSQILKHKATPYPNKAQAKTYTDPKAKG